MPEPVVRSHRKPPSDGEGEQEADWRGNHDSDEEGEQKNKEEPTRSLDGLCRSSRGVAKTRPWESRWRADTIVCFEVSLMDRHRTTSLVSPGERLVRVAPNS
jgi:hypothetical protein